LYLAHHQQSQDSQSKHPFHKKVLEDLLQSLCALESDSREAFLKQLSRFSSSLIDKKLVKSLEHIPRHKFIEIASIDINESLIVGALAKIAEDYADVSSFLTEVGGIPSVHNSQIQEDDSAVPNTNAKCKGSFVRKPHVTMAHFSQLSQQNMINNYLHVSGQPITVTITGILIGKSVVAFSIFLPEKIDSKISRTTPPCHNSFPHVTVWVEDGENAVRSNELPLLVEKGEAIWVKLAETIDVLGKFGFWFIE
jgi:hypothetical protein